MLKPLQRIAPAYDEDFSEWALAQADLLRAGRWAELDLENLIDEVQGVSKADWRSVESNLSVILLHLLKWRHQPAYRGASWRRSLFEHSHRVEQILRDSPSFRPRLPQAMLEEYELARVHASEETGIPYDHFPDSCPFNLEQVLDRRYFPDAVEPE